jgi:hypothetical protein
MDLEESIAADERAMDKIATALTRIAIVMEKRFEKEYPVKAKVQDATITYIPSDEEKLQESQGVTGESDEEWIGLHEREVLEQSAKKSPAKPRGSSKRIPPQAPRNKRR